MLGAIVGCIWVFLGLVLVREELRRIAAALEQLVDIKKKESK